MTGQHLMTKGNWQVKNFLQIKYLATDVNKCMTAKFEYASTVVNVLLKSGEMYC